MRKAELKVNDIFVIFYYDIFEYTKLDLAKLDVNIHSLCTWKDIIKVLEKNNIYNKEDVENLKEFLSNPDAWRKKNA